MRRPRGGVRGLAVCRPGSCTLRDHPVGWLFEVREGQTLCLEAGGLRGPELII